jgi:hypothetical protein
MILKYMMIFNGISRANNNINEKKYSMHIQKFIGVYIFVGMRNL